MTHRSSGARSAAYGALPHLVGGALQFGVLVRSELRVFMTADHAQSIESRIGLQPLTFTGHRDAGRVIVVGRRACAWFRSNRCSAS